MRTGQVVRRTTSALAGVIPLAVLPACGAPVVGSPVPAPRTRPDTGPYNTNTANLVIPRVKDQ